MFIIGLLKLRQFIIFTSHQLLEHAALCIVYE